MTKIAVGDALAHYFRLSGDDAGALRNRAEGSGLDPGEPVETAAPETLCAWTLAALAPNISAARAANDLGSCRDETLRLSTFLTNGFESMRGPSKLATFGFLAEADLIAFRDEDGAPAVVLRGSAHADHDARVLDPHTMAFASVGASARNIRVTAVLPGHALGALGLAAAGVKADVIAHGLSVVAEARMMRRAEGHRLSPQEGLTYA